MKPTFLYGSYRLCLANFIMGSSPKIATQMLDYTLPHPELPKCVVLAYNKRNEKNEFSLPMRRPDTRVSVTLD
ncbi:MULTISPECIES: hypothetical protein [Arenibacter]|uniref:hypothetical protein n=1 Tax=Arenibacter TaxID=178469 RepID=UPI0012FFD8CF|nr:MULTISPECIES: hypothetical protein [Arenibacter]